MPLLGAAVFPYRQEGKNKMRKWLLLMSACLCLGLCLPMPVPAAAEDAPVFFSYSLSPVSAAGEGQVRLDVKAVPTEVTAAGFRLRIQYDENLLDFLGTETSGAVKSGTMRTGGGSGLVSCVYVCNTDRGAAPRLSGTIASFLFQVAAGAPTGKTALEIAADQICDYDGNPLEAGGARKTLSLSLVPSVSPEASLTALKPSAGCLKPDFSPKIYFYTLQVGSETGAVEFQADAAQKGTVRVNRRTLNGAGRETEITVTVTSADRTRSAQYFITVDRAEKTAAASASAAETARKAGARSSGAAAKPVKLRKTGGTVSRRKSGSGNARDLSEREASLDQAAAQPEEARQESAGDRTLVVVGDRMPSFFTGMLAAVLCAVVGIAISLWLPIRLKRP